MAQALANGWRRPRWRHTPIAPMLALFAFRHYGYYLWPADVWGDVFTLGASCCLLACLALLPLWWPLKAWALGEELLTAGCTAWWLASPWAFSDERCSAQVGFKLGSIGLVLLALITHRVTLSTFAGSSESEPVKK